jgi:Cu+-exporting ATPase
MLKVSDFFDELRLRRDSHVADFGCGVGENSKILSELVPDGKVFAVESSDIVLLKGDIQKVAEAIHLAQRTNKTIWQNLIWSFGYNSVGIPIAGGILFPFFGWTLSPAIAGAIMAFESVTVVANSLRIKSMKL